MNSDTNAESAPKAGPNVPLLLLVGVLAVAGAGFAIWWFVAGVRNITSVYEPATPGTANRIDASLRAAKRNNTYFGDGLQSGDVTWTTREVEGGRVEVAIAVKVKPSKERLGARVRVTLRIRAAGGKIVLMSQGTGTLASEDWTTVNVDPGEIHEHYADSLSDYMVHTELLE